MVMVILAIRLYGGPNIQREHVYKGTEGDVRLRHSGL